MEISIKIDGRIVSVEISTEVGEFLEQSKRKTRNLQQEQQRHWDGRECDEYIIATEGRLPYRRFPFSFVTAPFMARADVFRHSLAKLRRSGEEEHIVHRIVPARRHFVGSKPLFHQEARHTRPLARIGS